MALNQIAANIAALAVGRDLDAGLAEMFDEIRMGRDHLDAILTGRCDPTSLDVAKVATLLGVTVDAVLFHHDSDARIAFLQEQFAGPKIKHQRKVEI